MFNVRHPHVSSTEQHTGCRRARGQPGHGDPREQEGCLQVCHLPLHLSGGTAGLFQAEGVSSAGELPSQTQGGALVHSKRVALRGLGSEAAALQPHPHPGSPVAPV